MQGVGAAVVGSTIGERLSSSVIAGLEDVDGSLDVEGADGAGEVVDSIVTGLLPHTFEAVIGLLSQTFSFETVIDVVFAEEFCFTLADFVFEDLDEIPLLETTTAVVVPQSSSSYKSISPDTSTDFSDLLTAELVVPTVFSALPIDVVEPEVTPPDGLQTLLSHELPPPRRRARPAFSALADDDASLPA